MKSHALVGKKGSGTWYTSQNSESDLIMDRFLGALLLISATVMGILIITSRVLGGDIENDDITHLFLFLILGFMLFDRADRK